jgi:hypothetical protein
MAYRDNQPTFNVNRKVANFGDFSANIEDEKEELSKMNRQNKPNSDEQQKNMSNSRYKFNKVTRKMDDLSPAEIQDKLDAIDELDETNELFNFNKERKSPLMLLKNDIDNAFKSVAVVNFDRTSGNKNSDREPSIEEVIRNIEEVISKYK